MQRRLRRAAAIVAIALAVTSLPIAFGSASAGQSTIRAVVNGVPITSNEIGDRARLLRLTTRTSGASIERQALEDLIDDQLKLAEGKRVGISVSDAQVDAAFASIAARMKVPPAVLAQGLGQQGISVTSLKSRLRTQILWQQLVVARFSHVVSISDSQIADALAKKQPDGKAAASTGKTVEYSLQQVILVAPKNADGRMREAEALRSRITSCAGLVDAVKPLPEALVKNLGKRTEDELPEAFRGLLADVPVGRLSKPQKTGAGVEMVAVCEKRDLTGDFQVRSKVEDEIRNKEGEVFARRYINELRRIAVIDYRK